MAGMRHPVKLGLASKLGFLTVLILAGSHLRGQDDDASFNNQPRIRQGTTPRGSTAPKRPTTRITDESAEERPTDSAVLEVQKLTP